MVGLVPVYGIYPVQPVGAFSCRRTRQKLLRDSYVYKVSNKRATVQLYQLQNKFRNFCFHVSRMRQLNAYVVLPFCMSSNFEPVLTSFWHGISMQNSGPADLFVLTQGVLIVLHEGSYFRPSLRLQYMQRGILVAWCLICWHNVGIIGASRQQA